MVEMRTLTRFRADQTIGASVRPCRRLPWATKLDRTENRMEQLRTGHWNGWIFRRPHIGARQGATARPLAGQWPARACHFKDGVGHLFAGVGAQMLHEFRPLSVRGIPPAAFPVAPQFARGAHGPRVFQRASDPLFFPPFISGMQCLHGENAHAYRTGPPGISM